MRSQPASMPDQTSFLSVNIDVYPQLRLNDVLEMISCPCFVTGWNFFNPRYSGLKWVVAEGNKVSKCKGIINWKVLLSTCKFNPSLRIEKWGEDAAPWKKHSDDFMQFHWRLSIWRTMLAHWQPHKTKESSQLTKLCSFSNENCATAILTGFCCSPERFEGLHSFPQRLPPAPWRCPPLASNQWWSQRNLQGLGPWCSNLQPADVTKGRGKNPTNSRRGSWWRTKIKRFQLYWIQR